MEAEKPGRKPSWKDPSDHVTLRPFIRKPRFPGASVHWVGAGPCVHAVRPLALFLPLRNTNQNPWVPKNCGMKMGSYTAVFWEAGQAGFKTSSREARLVTV